MNGQRISILGVGVDAVTRTQALDVIAGLVAGGTPQHVVTINPEFVMAARSNAGFREVLNGAALALPDGIGLLWAARIMGERIPERVAGSDIVPLIASRAAELGWSLFLLGAGPGVAARAAERLVDHYPGLDIAGTYGGSPAVSEQQSTVSVVRAASPDILLVAYGAPAQDLWISRNMERLGVPLCMGVGGTLDFVAGTRRRAPSWMQSVGLEWLFRLLQEPWRWRRQLALPRFVWAVLAERAKVSQMKTEPQG